MSTITIKDIARMCGVGVSTVSRAINNHPDINQETKGRIMRIIEENNYIPNNSARNLKRTDSNTIAILIKGIDNPFFQGMFSVFEQEMSKQEYSFIMHNVEENEDEISIALELEKEKKLKGIIFLGGRYYHSNDDMRQLKLPFVLCATNVTGKLDKRLYSSISIDDVKESGRIVDYLCSLGHKRIAIITSHDESLGHNRYLGYETALHKNNIEVERELIRFMRSDIKAFSLQNGYETTRELLMSGTEFTALFAISDSLAMGACKAILESGRRIPGDYSVAGFDGLEMSKFYHPTLTTMRQPYGQMARESMKLLFAQIEGKQTHQQRVYGAKLVEGQSSRRIQ